MTKCRVNWGRSEDGEAVRLWEIYNTSFNNLFVLAKDRNEALSIAHAAGHIYYTTNTLFDQGRRAYEVTGPSSNMSNSHWDMVQLAINRRVQGTVHFDGEQVAVGREVIAP
ncbi:MAG: hypothetical protein ACT4N8_12225 [Sphingosinicella sp.]|uniref:hypothetical protein n=1 Tax=Sphingosinicella sp. TaxID=1917971 RepID=UPI004037839E